MTPSLARTWRKPPTAAHEVNIYVDKESLNALNAEEAGATGARDIWQSAPAKRTGRQFTSICS